jgi:hypothetical protein
MSPLAAEQTELLRALARHGVEFVVVGGVAAQFHGWRGATADLDIAVSTDDSNVERLNLALAAVGAGNGASEPSARSSRRATAGSRSCAAPMRSVTTLTGSVEHESIASARD